MINEVIAETIFFENKIKELLLNFDLKFLLQLPQIELKDYSYYVDNLIPNKISGLYFLLHGVEGLLYIGKTVNLKARWAYMRADSSDDISYSHYKIHSMLERSLEMREVKLCWKELNEGIADLIEPLLIKYLNPKWNTIHRKKQS